MKCLRSFKVSASTHLDTADDEAWRRLTSALEVEVKLFGLRADAVQLSVDQLIQGLKTNENKGKKKPNEEDELMNNPQSGDSDQLIFKGGKEFIYEDDSYLQFNPEESELKNNPAFGYLGMIFDKEGTRGLLTNDLDIGQEKVQKLDIFKYNREIDMESYNFQNSNGSVMLLEDTQEFLDDLETLDQKSRKARLLPQLTKFCVEHSEQCRKDFQMFLIYSSKELQKYRESGVPDPSKEKFFDVMGRLDYEQDKDVIVPDMTQHSQAFGYRQRSSQFETTDFGFGFDQPIGQLDSDNGFPRQSVGEARPLMQEINEVLRNVPAVVDDLDIRSNTQMGFTDYNDFGGVEAMRSRNPDDYMTPNLENVFERAAKKLASIEQSMKTYNMRTDLRRQETQFKSANELFGPSNISAQKEKLAKVRRIIGPRDQTENSSVAQQRRQRPLAAIDFSIDPTENPPNASSIIEQMLAQENARLQKRSKPRNFYTDLVVDDLQGKVAAIEQKFFLPPEIEISVSTFNSLFTRDLQDFDLKLQMNELLERDKKEEMHLLKDDALYEGPGSQAKAFHDEDPAFGDPDAQNFGAMNLEQPGFDFDNMGDGMEFEDPNMPQQMFEVEGDLVGMNLLKNYMNFQPEAAISNLEKKLSQTYNFKISTFKAHVQTRYLNQLHPSAIQEAEQSGSLPAWLETLSTPDGKLHRGVRFSRVCKELMLYWKRHHDVEVTLQACFLTILHMCTENGLMLIKGATGENDFFITATGAGGGERVGVRAMR